MNHPDDLLATYVDGSLPGREAGTVETHLAECPRCRHQVEMAHAARAALAGLPAEEMPQHVTAAILREAAAEPARPAGPPGWYRWAGVAAAAAVVVLVAVALPSLGDQTRETQAASESSSDTLSGVQDGRSAQPDTDALTLQVSDVPLTLASVQDMALALRSAAPAIEGSAATASVGEPNTNYFAVDATPHPEGTASALACLHRAFSPGFTTDPVRLIEAPYEGERVYLATTLEGPGAGQPPDAAYVWIADKAHCSVVGTTQVLLNP